MHSSTISRIEKARRYASEPHRLRIQTLRLTVHGEHADHQVELIDQQWTCDCGHFRHHGTCAHVMAAERLLGPLLPAAAQPHARQRLYLDEVIPPVVPRD